MKLKKIIPAFSVIAALIIYLNMSGRKSIQNKPDDSPTDVDKPRASTQSPLPPPPSQRSAASLSPQSVESLTSKQEQKFILDKKTLHSTIKHLSLGHSIKKTPDLKSTIENLSANWKLSLPLLAQELKKMPIDDVAGRSHVFGLLIEVAVQLKKMDPNHVDEFINDVYPMIKQQLDVPFQVEAQFAKKLTEKQIDELIHMGPFKYEGSTLMVNTFQAKFMSIAVLKKAGTENSKKYLGDIAGDSGMDPLIRKIADHHSKE